MAKFDQIIREGIENGTPIAEINKKLKEAGANFHLNPDGSKSNWTEQEMKEGFIHAEKEPEDVKHLKDYMRFSLKMAGKTETYWVAEGKYSITWDEDGRPVKAIRQN